MKQMLALAAITAVAHSGYTARGTCQQSLIRGGECIIKGDPHTNTVQNSNHDFHGKPMTKNPDGTYRDAFYYVARCSDVEVEDMPYQIIATQYYAKEGRTAASTDYITIELSDKSGDTYYVYLSAAFQFYAKGGSVSYDVARKQYGSSLKKLPCGNARTKIGQFVIRMTRKKRKLSVKLYAPDRNGKMQLVRITMSGSAYRERHPQYPYQDRRRQTHMVIVKQANAFKCAQCGLCGQFRKKRKKDMIEDCDGNDVRIKDGRNARAFDANGLSYEYFYFNNKCGRATYTPPVGNPLPPPIEDCPEELQDRIVELCDAARDEATANGCCSEVDDKCDEAVTNCYDDVCTETDGDDDDELKEAVQALLFDAVCQIKEFEEADYAAAHAPLLDNDDGDDDYNQYPEDDDEDEDDDMFFDEEDIDDDDDLFNFPAEAIPVSYPSNPNGSVIQLTATELLIAALVIFNVAIVGATVCFCLRQKQALVSYDAVKNAYASDDDEALVAQY